MYTMSASAQANFLSTDFMGVSSNATVTNAAVDGAINIVKIKSGGTGCLLYTSPSPRDP